MTRQTQLDAWQYVIDQKQTKKSCVDDIAWDHNTFEIEASEAFPILLAYVEKLHERFATVFMDTHLDSDGNNRDYCAEFLDELWQAAVEESRR